MIFSRKHSIGVLVVCTANICRSPMAEGLLREALRAKGLHRRVIIDSAGTRATQPGHPADGRAQQVCARIGVELRRCRARQVVAAAFSRFDYVLAVDAVNRSWLLDNCPPQEQASISLLGEWAAPVPIGDVPDPYYGSLSGFERTLELLQQCVAGFVPALLARLDD